MAAGVLGAGTLVDSSIAGGFTSVISTFAANLSNVVTGVRIDAGGGNINYGCLKAKVGKRFRDTLN